MRNERALAGDLLHALRPRPDEGSPARSSPAGLAQHVSRGAWVPARHLMVINEHLCALAAGDITRLLILAPPRHGKSELCSHYHCAWFLGRYPDKRVMLCSQEADFAATFGRKVRDTVSVFGPSIFGVAVRSDVSAAGRFELDGFSGGMLCVGAGGQLTGRGADLLVLDDIVKNIEEANSQTVRDHTWEWYQTTALTRLEPGGRVLCVMTHWHEDDIAGRLCAIGGDEAFTVLRFPAVAEHDDPLGRAEGEPLWPERYPLAELQARRREMGTRSFTAMYQGAPTPAEGALFKRADFRYFTETTDAYDLGGRILAAGSCVRFATVDLAVSTKNSADYTVVLVGARTPRNELLVLDVIRKRVEGADHLPLLKGACARYQLSSIYIERANYELALLQQAGREGLPVRELRPDKDKVSRATFAAARLESGDVYFRASAPWLEDFEAELLSFPAGRHDDQVDALSYAVTQGLQGGWTAAEIYSVAGYIECPDCGGPTPPRGDTYREVVVTRCIACGAELPEDDLPATPTTNPIEPADGDDQRRVAGIIATWRRMAAGGGLPYHAVPGVPPKAPSSAPARAPRGTNDCIYFDETRGEYVEDLTTPRPLPGAPWPPPDQR